VRSLCNITEVEDISEMVDDDVSMLNSGERRHSGHKSYLNCRNCNSKIGDTGKAMMECGKCNTKIKLAIK